MLKIDEMVPFFGVIENIDDPEEQDRVQVRCFGYHPENKGFIATEFLQWFYPLSNDHASVSGIGVTGSRYKQGSYVFGFFLSSELQEGVILGSLVGKPTHKAFTNMGFNDPEGVYPLYVNESDVNRIARGKNLDKTIVQYKINTRIQGVPTASGGSWNEPESDFATQYPNNRVFETESGHVVEYDDTPGAERISINHRTGSYQEYLSDGTKIDKTVSDAFSIFLGGHFIFVNGNVNQFINGNVDQNVTGDYRIKANSITFDSDVKITGNSEATDHISSGISGADHTHEQPNDTAGDTQLPTESPTGKNSGFNKGSVDSFSVDVQKFDPSIRES